MAVEFGGDIMHNSGHLFVLLYLIENICLYLISTKAAGEIR